MKNYLTWKMAKRLVIAVIGGTVVLVGIAMIVLPGPGWIIVFAGLGILATEFVWAATLLRRVKKRVKQTTNGLLNTLRLTTTDTDHDKDKQQTDRRNGTTG